MDPIIIDFSIIINQKAKQTNQGIEENFSKEIIEPNDKSKQNKNRTKKQDSNETVSIASDISDEENEEDEDDEEEEEKGEPRKFKERVLKSKKYSSYPESLRLQVKKALKTYNPPEVALKYNINLITLRRWIKDKFVRKERQGERCITSQIKQPLLKWINKKGIINLTKKEIREKAMSLCKNKEFKASHRWYQAFMKKCNLPKPKIARLELEKLNAESNNKTAKNNADEEDNNSNNNSDE